MKQILTKKYRLYPTATQVERLDWVRRECCTLYNASLQHRRDAYKMRGVSITKQQQSRELTELKHDGCEEYNTIGDHVLRDVLDRVDKAYLGFFRRIKRGQKAGYPRFRSNRRYDSFKYPDLTSWKLEQESGSGSEKRFGRLMLRDGEGYGIKIKMHRPLAGTPKQLTIKREGDEWYACIVCEVETVELPPSDEEVGINRGIVHLAGLSNGNFITNPKYLQKSLAKITRHQQNVSRSKRGSNRRVKQVKLLAGAHRKVARQRADYLHKASRQLVNQYGTIYIEDLDITAMTARPEPVLDEAKTKELGQAVYAPNGAAASAELRRGFGDAGLGYFEQMLTYKAAGAGRKVVKVDARYISTDCPRCGNRQEVGTERTYVCASCGATEDVDIKAAIIVLRRGQEKLRNGPGNGPRAAVREGGLAVPLAPPNAKSSASPPSGCG